MVSSDCSTSSQFSPCHHLFWDLALIYIITYLKKKNHSISGRFRPFIEAKVNKKVTVLNTVDHLTIAHRNTFEAMLFVLSLTESFNFFAPCPSVTLESQSWQSGTSLVNILQICIVNMTQRDPFPINSSSLKWLTETDLVIGVALTVLF